MNEKTKKDLEEIFDDDLLKCEIVKSVENEDIKASLLRCVADGTFSVAAVIKPTKKLAISQQISNEKDAREYFKKWYDDVYVA